MRSCVSCYCRATWRTFSWNSPRTRIHVPPPTGLCKYHPARRPALTLHELLSFYWPRLLSIMHSFICDFQCFYMYKLCFSCFILYTLINYIIYINKLLVVYMIHLTGMVVRSSCNRVCVYMCNRMSLWKPMKCLHGPFHSAAGHLDHL